MENSPLICPANQWIGLCMTGISVMKELNLMIYTNYKILSRSSC